MKKLIKIDEKTGYLGIGKTLIELGNFQETF